MSNQIFIRGREPSGCPGRVGRRSAAHRRSTGQANLDDCARDDDRADTVTDRGRGTGDRPRPARERDEDREAVILEEAVSLGEPGCPQPLKLILDGGAAVMRHPLERARPFGVVGPGRTSARFVPALIERCEPR